MPGKGGHIIGQPEEVAVRHFGNGVLLLPTDEPWGMLDAALAAFEPGFMLSREQPEQQVRPEIEP